MFYMHMEHNLLKFIVVKYTLTKVVKNETYDVQLTVHHEKFL